MTFLACGALFDVWRWRKARSSLSWSFDLYLPDWLDADISYPCARPVSTLFTDGENLYDKT